MSKLLRRCRIDSTAALGAAWLILLGGSVPKSLEGQTPAYELTGHVSDRSTGVPLSGVTIRIVDLSREATSDARGFFRFAGVPEGRRQIAATRLGYQDLPPTPVWVGQGMTSDLRLEMTPEALTLSELVVTPGAYGVMGGIAGAQQTMTRGEIESVPQFAEDIFRAVNRLPGLTSGDFSARFSIRASRPDETLILLDGLEIYEPYHLKDFNDGAISIIDVEAIDGVELLTGGFGAEHGNRTAGVFSMTPRDAVAEGVRYRIGASLVNARAMAEGTFSEGRGSWFVSGRRGYLDLVEDILHLTDLPSPSYRDVFARGRYDFSAAQRLTVNLLHAHDAYTFNAEATTGFADSIATIERAGNTYGNTYAWLRLRSLFGERLELQTLASIGQVTAHRDGAEEYVLAADPLYRITNDRDLDVLTVKQDVRAQLTPSLLLQAGYDLRSMRMSDRFENQVGQNPDDPSDDQSTLFPQVTRSALRRSGSTLGAYVSGRMRPVERLAVDLGLRYDRASYTGDRDWSPRVGAVLDLGDGRFLRAGWGIYRQIQGVHEVAVLDELTDYFPSERNELVTAGFEQRWSDRTSLRIEAYSKRGSRLRPVYRNWKGGLDTFPETNEDRILVFPESMRAKGVEVMGQRSFGDRWFLSASFAWADARETAFRIDNVNVAQALEFSHTHALPQDQRHALKLDASYRTASSWTFNGAFSFHTGWPSTLERLVDYTRPDGMPDPTIRTERLYGSRFPAYQRFDVRATKRMPTRRGDLRFFVEITNLTNHANVFGYDYFRERDQNGSIVLRRDEETGFIILPSLGVSWSGPGR
ncbi:MAG: TonB-dependent receptor [Gemmatimonadota bacterium]